MKRYWLFGDDNYYPRGGMEDFLGAFDSIDEALSQYDSRGESEDYWCHVFDSRTKRVVAHGQGQSCYGTNTFEELDKVRDE